MRAVHAKIKNLHSDFVATNLFLCARHLEGTTTISVFLIITIFTDTTTTTSLTTKSTNRVVNTTTTLVIVIVS